jgi:CRP-like cAMP-binding protein
MCKKNQEALILRAPELFAGLSHFARREMLSTARHGEFMDGGFVFWAGAPASQVFLLTSGRVRIIQSNKNGAEIILRIVARGELVNLPQTNPEGTHNSTAEAIEESKALVWDAATFVAALSRFPILARNVQHILEQRIYDLSQRFCDVATAKASPRLARQLLSLLRQIGVKRNGRWEIKIPHEWMAEMAALSQFTVSRFLAKWERQGVLKVRHGTVTIRDDEGLKRLCQESRVPAN